MRLLAFLICLAPHFLLAQIPLSKWSVGVNVSLDNNYRILHLKEKSYQTTNIKDSRDLSEIPLFGISIGGTLQYQLTPKFNLSLGVQYAQNGFQSSKYSTLVYNLNTRTWTPAKASFIINYNYVDVPLVLRYKFGKQKVKFMIGAGVAANFLSTCEEESKIYYSNQTDTYHFNRKSLFNEKNLSVLFNIGAYHQISNRINFLIEPTIRYQLMENINLPVTERLYNIGLNLSVFYRL